MNKARLFMCMLCVAWMSAQTSAEGVVSVADYPSIQAAIDANPGKVLFVPPGEYHIKECLLLNKDNSGLWGYGTIIQDNTAASMARVDSASHVILANLTFTRAKGHEITDEEGIRGNLCSNLTLRDIQVLENQSRNSAILITDCAYTTIQGCRIHNYKKVTVDDRMQGNDIKLYGYAFNCIDGTGISIRQSKATQILYNRVTESNFIADNKTKAKYDLGKVIRRAEKLGPIVPPSVEKSNSVNNWHQGSAILVTEPLKTEFTLIDGNYIDNAGQGIDIHSDYVILTHNVIDHAFLGMKAMHGSKHVIVNENQFIRSDLWAVMMMPGSSSHPAEAATQEHPARKANLTSQNMIANNIISDFGFGYEYETWWDNDPDGHNPCPIAMKSGQLPTNPLLEDILIEGNIVYDIGRDKVMMDGNPTLLGPRYKSALHIQADISSEEIHLSGNIFHKGEKAVMDVKPAP